MHQCSPLGGGVVCKMYQVSYLYFNCIMTYRLLEKLGEGKYEDLFIAALRYHGMLCIGLYRYLDLESNPNSGTSRYVITNPPGSFDMHPTDKIFVFMPYNS